MVNLLKALILAIENDESSSPVLPETDSSINGHAASVGVRVFDGRSLKHTQPSPGRVRAQSENLALCIANIPLEDHRKHA